MSEEAEVVGTVQDTFDIFLGSVEDYLKAFDVPQSDIDDLKRFTPFRSLFI